MTKKKICVVVGSRANYSSIKAVMRAVQLHPDLELQVVAGASAVLDRYGAVVEIMERDGFKADAKLFMLVEGETPATMAKSTGLGLIELPTIFENLMPDIVLTVGDRFETMATTLAAAYMNIPLAHTMGGEVSGNIDENIRHAVTKFANIHFPASEDARERIIKLGERPETVHNTGCPRMDIVAEILRADEPIERQLFAEGVGVSFPLEEGFILVSQHPVTGEYGAGERQITATLKAVRSTGLPAIVLWPNADAGSEDVSRGIRKYRERNPDARFHYVKNLPPDIYLPLMAKTRCLVGNSSSAIREGAFIGTPCVNVGSRQTARQRGDNVIDAGYDEASIHEAIADRIRHGRFPMNPIYGNGTAGPRIADLLATEEVQVAKHIAY
jgi:UDP-hydrolysing UDP-N-acetyl-D-glucosamine 2-epimerase